MVKLTPKYRQNLNLLLKNAGLDADQVDTQALWDPEISYYENLRNLSEQLGVSLISKEERERQEKAALEVAETRARKDYEVQVRTAEAEAIKSIVEKKVAIEGEYFEVPRTLIKTVAQGYSNNLILTGPGGLSKSFTTLSTMSELGLRSDDDFVYIQGYTTPLMLYQKLYEHREKLIIFDDVEGILDDIKASSILKAAMWSASGTRTVQYFTTSKALEAPSQFIFQGKIILCTNAIPRKNDEGLKALLSRSLCYEFRLSFSDKTRIIAAIASNADYKDLTREERLEVFDYIKSNSDETTDNYNIRTLLLACDVYKHSKEKGGDWKIAVNEMLERNESLKVLKDIMDTYDTTKEQVREFCQQTGMSAMTYYRYKKKLSYEVRAKMPPASA